LKTKYYFKNKLKKYSNLIEDLEYIDNKTKSLLIDSNDTKKIKDYINIIKKENKLFSYKDDDIDNFENNFNNYSNAYSEIYQYLKKNKIIIKDNNKIDINKTYKELKFLIKNYKSDLITNGWYNLIRNSIKNNTYYIIKSIGLSFKSFYFIYKYFFNLKPKRNFLSQKELDKLINEEPDNLNPDIMLKKVHIFMQKENLNNLSKKDLVDISMYMYQYIIASNKENNKNNKENKILLKMQNITNVNDDTDIFNYYKKKCLEFFFNKNKENKYVSYDNAIKVIEENFREPKIIKKANNIQSLNDNNINMIDSVINCLGNLYFILSNIYNIILNNPNIDKKMIIAELNILANKDKITEYDILKLRDKFT